MRLKNECISEDLVIAAGNKLDLTQIVCDF